MFENTKKSWSVNARAAWLKDVAAEIEKRQVLDADWSVSLNIRDGVMSLDTAYFFTPGSHVCAMISFTETGATTGGKALPMDPAEAAEAIGSAQRAEEARRDKMKDAANKANAFEKETEDIPF